jgi:two-component system chemotaxis response regulator CheB
MDFVAKPRRREEDLKGVGAELVQKIRAVRLARPSSRRGDGAPRGGEAKEALLIGLGASTGGPPAIQRVLESLSIEPSLSLLIAQHMPSLFTRAFAERLDRIGPYTVQEGHDGDPVLPGHAYVAPGGRQMLVVRRQRGLYLKVRGPVDGEKHAPSVDVLFRSLAEAAGDRAMGVVLTGMGADGADGARALQRAGAEVWAESEKTAVIFGMPQEAIGTGACRRVLPLEEIGPALAALARRRRMGARG